MPGCRLDLRRYLRPLAGLFHFDRIEEGHHGAQLFAHFLDFLLLFFLTGGVEPFAAGLILFDPLAGEGSILNFAQDLAHGFPGLLVDDARARRCSRHTQPCR